MSNRGGVITGWGSAQPDRVVTNADLPVIMNTNDAWIVERTGIRERRWGGTVAEHATEAGRKAIEMAGLAPTDIDLLVLATSAPDQIFPGTSAHVQDNLGLRCGAFDVQAACSGFVYALTTAHGFLELGLQRILVVGAEVLSKIFAPDDRATGVLFADGAGAVVLEAREVADDGPGVLATRLHADGAHNGLLYVDGGPSSTGTVGKVRMKGPEVFRHAVVNLAQVLREVLADQGLTPADIDWVVPHQANQRILDATARKLGLPPEKVVVTVDRHANTSAASVPLALDTAIRDGRIKPGDLVVLEAMGGGFTWGASLVRI